MKVKELKEKDLLYREIEWWIERIRNKKTRYTTLYRISKILTFVAGAAITVIVGWKEVKGTEFDHKNIVLVISTSITLLAALEGLFSLRDKAKSYDVFLFDLRRLRDKMAFEYIKDPALYEQKRDSYFQQYEEILEAQKMIIENSYAKEE